MSMTQVNLMHVLLIGPLLYYIGDTAPHTPDSAYNALAALSVMIVFIVRPPWFGQPAFLNLVNASHYLIWIALFAYIAWRKNATPTAVLDILRPLAIAVIAIHMYFLIWRALGRDPL